MRRAGVLLLHGIGRGAMSMGRLEQGLRDAGYRTLNLDYPSRRAGIAELATHVEAASRRFVDSFDGRFPR